MPIGRFDCNHYFASVNLCGACFSGHDIKDVDYDNITTILTREEFNQLIEFDKAIGMLGYSIERGDERYNKGVELVAGIKNITDKLDSKENEYLFEVVVSDEREFMRDEFNLSDEDINDIFDYYGLEYRDRGIISCVFKDVEDMGREEAVNFGVLSDSGYDKYFDYEAYGNDLLENSEQYFELRDGRIVMLDY